MKMLCIYYGMSFLIKQMLFLFEIEKQEFFYNRVIQLIFVVGYYCLRLWKSKISIEILCCVW